LSQAAKGFKAALQAKKRRVRHDEKALKRKTRKMKLI
jgi:hypothetical protein